MVNSVLIKNIQTLKESINQTASYVDLNFRGIVDQTKEITDENGQTKTYTERTVEVKNVNCLLDQFRIWLMSSKGDFHRRPNEGGFLEKNVVKRPFTDENCPVIAALLKSEAEHRFRNLQIIDIDVSCDHSSRRWMIKVSILDKKTGLYDNTMYVNGESIAVDSAM